MTNNNNITDKINLKATQILEKIKSNDDTFIIFGISTCGYCQRALEYLKNNSLQFKYYEMDKYHEIFLQILDRLIELNKSLNIDKTHRTFPVIFYNQKFIGGYTQLTTFDKK